MSIKGTPVAFVYTFTPAFLEWLRETHWLTELVVKAKNITSAFCETTLLPSGDMGPYKMSFKEDKGTHVFSVIDLQLHPEKMAMLDRIKGSHRVQADTLRKGDRVYVRNEKTGCRVPGIVTTCQALYFTVLDPATGMQSTHDVIGCAVCISDEEIKYPKTREEFIDAVKDADKLAEILRQQGINVENPHIRIPPPLEPLILSWADSGDERPEKVMGYNPIWDAASFGFE
jgi:hypothetical protein